MPRNHHLPEEILHEYLDDALERDGHAEVQAHLRVCPTCQARMTKLEGVFTALGQFREEPLSRDLVPDTMEALRVRRRYPTVLRPIIALQAIVAIIIVIAMGPHVFPALSGWVAGIFGTSLMQGSLWAVTSLMSLGELVLSTVRQLNDVGSQWIHTAVSLAPAFGWRWIYVVALTAGWLVSNGFLLRRFRSRLPSHTQALKAEGDDGH